MFQKLIQYKMPEKGWVTYATAYGTRMVNEQMRNCVNRYGHKYKTRVA